MNNISIEKVSDLLERALGYHLFALSIKEAKQILRNKFLVFLLLVPPIIQLLILGASLDPQVRGLNLGIVDYARTKESRDLVTALTINDIFPGGQFYPNEKELTSKLEDGKLDAGIIIPPELSRNLNQTGSSRVAVLVDGADAYSAGIADAYILNILYHFKPESTSTPATSMGAISQTAMQEMPKSPDSLIDPKFIMLYNPGLLSSWYFVPGVLGAALTLTSTLVASATILREKENGTMEKLLMTPAATSEIWLAKMIPLVVFLLADVALAIFAARLVFGLPFRGSLLLFAISSALYVFVGIGLGMLLGIICGSQRQAQLTSFFINIPMILLSGAVVPFDTMPDILKTVSIVDPLRYYTDITRGVILKGSGFNFLWSELCVLAIFSTLVLLFSLTLFRRQVA